MQRELLRMFVPGDVISYHQMCLAEGTSLQRGMNFQQQGKHSIVLMSVRPGAPYNDYLEDDGRVLIYEGHDIPRSEGIEPKRVDQPLKYPGGSLTQNGLFFESARRHKLANTPAELVRVYEKLRPGIWVYNGLFELVDAWQEEDTHRSVCKFKLVLSSKELPANSMVALEHSRMIPSSVKQAVWKRDKGQCVQCGSTVNLHFDHVIPYSKGGTSLLSENIQLLCAKCNLSKSDRIE
jgi:hypothetical protein